MAFYLSRTFAKKPDHYVLNDLHIIHEGETAQMNHLLVTQYSLFIIESKSVHGKITINKSKEFVRSFNGKTQGMASPINQAEAQGKVLKSLLIGHKEQLREKALFGMLQWGFKYCPILIYVAISDTGDIDRKVVVPEVFKADDVTKALEAKLAELKSKFSLFSTSTNAWRMELDEAKNVADFLLNQHTPLIKNTPPPIKTAITEPVAVVTPKTFIAQEGAICPQCNHHQLIKKSIKRSDNTETDFLACAAHTKECKGIYALPRHSKETESPLTKANTDYQELDVCPRCKNGKLIICKGKTEFLGCSLFPKCRFTDYKQVIYLVAAFLSSKWIPVFTGMTVEGIVPRST